MANNKNGKKRTNTKSNSNRGKKKNNQNINKQINKNSVNNKQKNIKKSTNVTEVEVPKNNDNKSNIFVMKFLVFLGTAIFCFIVIYLMYYFFVKKSDIKINVSTDKQFEYITVNGQKELISTQNYVSDLNYSMRYAMKSFKVFKYKEQDIFKNLQDERVLVVVEKSALPTSCNKSSSKTEYNDCFIIVDAYTKEYYMSQNNVVYKITTKIPTNVLEKELDLKIEKMLKSFTIN